MGSIIKKVFILLFSVLLFGFLNGKNLAETKKNLIINFLCLENFREEMFKAKIIYDEEIAKSTCDCYVEEFSKSAVHQKAIKKCKLESQEKFNLQSNNYYIFNAFY